MTASFVEKKQSSGGVLSKDVLKNCTKFTDLCRSLFNKEQAGNLKLPEGAYGDVR